MRQDQMPRAPKTRRVVARPAKGTRPILASIRTRSRRPPNAPSDATRVGVAVSRYAMRSTPAPAPPARRRDAGSTRYGCTACWRNSLEAMHRMLWCLIPAGRMPDRSPGVGPLVAVIMQHRYNRLRAGDLLKPFGIRRYQPVIVIYKPAPTRTGAAAKSTFRPSAMVGCAITASRKAV